MADKLHFSLVAPERELYSGEVDHVIAPGVEGEFGVLPRHAPFMTTLKAGALRILDGGSERRIFVRGGFADVTPDGLTVLAEEAIDLAGLNSAQFDREIKDLEAELALAKDEAKRAELSFRIDRAAAIRAAL